MNRQAHYIRLYKKADEILRQPDNPCQIRMEDGVATCVVSRRKGYEHFKGQLCCTGCRHLGPEGCTVMSLGCKLGWCYTNHAQIIDMAMQDHPTFEKIATIRKEAVALKLPALWGRRSMREAFEGGY